MSHEPALITLVGRYVKPDRDMPFLEGMSIYDDAWEKKDRPFAKIRSAMPSANFEDELYQTHIIKELTPISSQGHAGTCVANAWCDSVEILIGLERGESAVVQLSRRFAYWISRYLHSATDVDDGTFLRAMGHQFRKVGVILEDLMPYSDRESDLIGKKASPKLEHYTMGSNNRIDGFYRLSRDGEQMLREAEIAIRSNHPVVFGVPVSSEFQQNRAARVFGPPEYVIGHHCMIIVGVRQLNDVRQWLVRNSWSKYWGDEGHCWITDDYFKLSEDTWVGTMLKPLV